MAAERLPAVAYERAELMLGHNRSRLALRARVTAEPAAIDVAPYVGRYYARSDTAVELVRRDGAAALRLLVTGLLRDRFPATAGEFALVPVAAGRFAMRTPDSRTWEIVQAHRPPGGPPYLYNQRGLVANPLVGAPAG
jgi:hypothetical protein